MQRENLSLLKMSINQFSAVVAVARNGTIGRSNTLPWKLRSDLQRFKRLTMGHSLVMGRKTFESIGKPLPGRQTIVLSRKESSIPGVRIAKSLEQAATMISPETIGFIVGGAEIYRVAIPLIQNFYVTQIMADIAGDAFLDNWNEAEFNCLESTYVPADAFNDWPSEFRHLVRRSHQ